MKIAIAGGTGFVGKALTDYLANKGHTIYILTRRPKIQPNHIKNTHYIGWLTPDSIPDGELPTIDAFVNLAGESINNGRWTAVQKQRIVDSRIHSTRELMNVIKKMKQLPKVLINASAIGFYGHSFTETFTEKNDEPGTDFLAETTMRWEQEALQAEKLGVRTVLTRFGIILDQDNGALPKMLLPYKLLIGGKVGSGKQWLSWIHIKDVVKMIEFAMDNVNIAGPLNMTAPDPKKMDEFGKTIGAVLQRPHWIPVPSFTLKLLLGEMSSLVLDGQRVLPEKALHNGYIFEFPNLDNALKDLLKST